MLLFYLFSSHLFFLLIFPNFLYFFFLAMLKVNGMSLQLKQDRWLFKDVDIELNKGETLVLRGPSGAG